MPKQTFVESGLSFEFPEDWKVLKYDSHRFYGYLSGSGLKGVDFIALNGEQLFLIEIKNYVERYYKDGQHPMDALMDNQEAYAFGFQRKFTDTIKLLEVIGQYYKRKWWFWIFQKSRYWFSLEKVIQTEAGFWTRAFELLQKKDKVELILWLELSPKFDLEVHNQLNTFFEKKLKESLSPDMKFTLTNQKKPFPGIILSK